MSKRTRVQLDFVLRGPHTFDPNRLLDFVDAGCRRLGVQPVEIEPGARIRILAQPEISNGARVRIKNPTRREPRGIGRVIGHPRNTTYATRVEWPNARGRGVPWDMLVVIKRLQLV